MSLPLFGFADELLQRFQTQWSAALNPVIKNFLSFNTKPPQITVLNSGSGIYRPPADLFYLEILLVGAGGGGGASGQSGFTAAGNGTDTTFGTNLLVAKGGLLGGSGGGAGGTGGVSSLATIKGIAIAGGSGQGYAEVVLAGQAFPAGGMGGASYFGGAGGGGSPAGAGNAAAPNSGSGGGGGGVSNAAADFAGCGGGSGGLIHGFITDNIQDTYGFVIGIGGVAGIAGVNGSNGGRGADGIALIKAYFQ